MIFSLIKLLSENEKRTFDVPMSFRDDGHDVIDIFAFDYEKVLNEKSISYVPSYLKRAALKIQKIVHLYIKKIIE